MAPRRLVVLGDSWAFLGFPALDAEWAARYPSAPASLNYGRVSTRYGQWLSAWDAVQSHPDGDYGPLNTVLQAGDLVVLQLGGNDELQRFVVPTDATAGFDAQKANRDDLITRILGLDPSILILTFGYYSPITGSPVGLFDQVGSPHPVSERNRRSVAGDGLRPNGVAFADRYKGRVEYLFGMQAAMSGTLQFADGLHLTAAGYTERAEYVDAHSMFWNHEGIF